MSYGSGVDHEALPVLPMDYDIAKQFYKADDFCTIKKTEYIEFASLGYCENGAD